MYEKVNPSHPDKVADRIAGAIIDLAYTKNKNPKAAVEVLLGHEDCYIIIETSESFSRGELDYIVARITEDKDIRVWYNVNRQDEHLADNQSKGIRCGDNGIFKGTPITQEQEHLTRVASSIYKQYPFDGKYLINRKDITICQSNLLNEDIDKIDTFLHDKLVVNPLGPWTGGPNVDSGATNRKLGSDMGDGVTGGGLHGKDLSKADVSVNIWCHLKAQEKGHPIHAICNIGDDTVATSLGDIPYKEIVDVAREYINHIGGFEKFAEWGLIRPTE